MIKNDLREQGFSVIEKVPKKSRINMTWVISVVIYIIVTILGINLFFIITMGMDGSGLAKMRSDLRGINDLVPYNRLDPLTSFVDMFDQQWVIVPYLIIFVSALALYLALKLVLTIIVCRDKINSTKLKFLENKGIPVCFCKEALKVWQTMLIYALPALIMYSLLFAANIMTWGEPIYMLLFVFMSFFLSFDWTLIIYVLAVSRKEKIDYISVDHHFYSLTLFKQTYVRFSDKVIRRNAEIEKSENKNKPKAFIKMTTCLNPKCENYGQESDKNIKICPSCGNRKFKAEVLTNVVTCLAEDCENYGQELKREIEICSVCGEKTGKIAFKFNSALAIPAIVISIISSVAFGYLYQRSSGKSMGVVDLFRNVNFATGLIMGFLSKSKIAFIVSILSVIFIIVFIIALQ